MCARSSRLAVSGVCLLFLSAASRSFAAEPPRPKWELVCAAAETRLRAGLEAETRFDFVETPLDQVLQFLREAHSIPIELDRRSLDEAGIATDTPVTRSLKGIRLGSALRLLLEGLGLDYVVREEVVLVMSGDKAAEFRSRPTVRAYRVSGLLRDGETAASLAATLTQTLSDAPPWPALPGVGALGGGVGFFSLQEPAAPAPGARAAASGELVPAPGTPVPAPTVTVATAPPVVVPAAPQPPEVTLRIVPYRDALLVRATADMHEELARVLSAIGELQSAAPAPAPLAPATNPKP